MDLVELILRHPQKRKEEVSISFELFDLPLAKRWAEMLREALQRPHVLEKNSSFIGFIHGLRNRDFLANQLNEACERIRQYRGDSPWHVPYSIPQICPSEQIPLELLNEFHHHFETLMGGTFSVSDYYRNAPAEIRNAIRLINYTVHELESVERSWLSYSSSKKIYPYSVVEFLEKEIVRRDLADEDYSLFSLANVFGDLQIAYCQTGKTPYEAWRDRDENIFAKNINGVQFYSANFLIRWGHSSDPNKQQKNIVEPFRQWLMEKGADLRHGTYYVDQWNKRQGLGFLTIGRLATQKTPELAVSDWQNLVGNHPDIARVRLHEGKRITEKTYDYSLGDEEFAKRLAAMLDS
jgi:hypothetical protein